MDNFVVEMVPTCRKPTGVNASAVTKRSATIGWTSDATEWVVAYKADADEDFTEVAAVTENSYTLTGLAPETAYTVKVRTNCGGGDYSDWTALVNFTTDIACPVPTALQANNISAYVAELNWTSDASQWDIAYRANGSDEFTEITGVTQKPYTLQDLNPETTYEWKVRAYYPEEEGYSTWTSLSSFTTNETCPTPTDLYATAVRSTSADVAWTGSIDVTDYSVRYRVPQHVADGINETFDAGSCPANWSRYNGKLNNDGTATLNGSSSGFSFGPNNGVFDSHARINIYSNNQRWLITPRFTLAGSTLSFDMALTAYSGTVSAPDTNGTDDRFIVLISTDNMATWTILREWNNSGSEYVYNNITCTKTGEQVSIDLSSYIDQTVHIAFYGESTVGNADNNLHIDNVLIGQMVPATEWVTVGTTETEATLTGLTPLTPYEVQVKSNCSEPEEWTEAIKFTTTIPELTLALNDPAMGSVAIDGDELPAGVTDKGNGTYAVLPGTELTLKAQANDTYYLTAWVDADSTEITTGTNFADFLWNNSSLPTTATLNITMGTDDVTAQAIFATAGISLNVPAHEFVTYYADKTVTLPTMENGIQLYSVSSVSDTEVTLTSAIDVANTETPLLIYNSGAVDKNLLLITNVGTPANNRIMNDGDKVYYTCSYDPNGPDFNLNGTLDHGTIAFTVYGNAATTAKEGQTVTVTVTADEGYTVQSITGEWSTTFEAAHSRRRTPALTTIPVLGNIELTPVDGQENTWTFTMEAANATFAATLATIPYNVIMAKDTEDADNWAITPAEATTTGVAIGTEITATYSGTKHVKSVKAKKKAPATDLSMVDCAGTARTDGQWTANCYMVHTAGDYKLPLVYGNAIKAGATNAAAYTGVENANTTLTFPRHDGEAITAPWIKDNNITVTSAELLWQDADGLITAVGIDGDYLTLTVGTDAATQEGNALVAAKDGEGNVVWSWHIWVTKQTFAAADLTTVDTGEGGHVYTVTPVNLGWVGDDIYTGTNTFYQWGRKDPFKGTGTVTSDGSTTATIADNIKNPATFYNVNYKPSNTTYRNMWDAQQTGTDAIATATVKTVYDPSPAGFCVPTGNLYYYMKNGSGVSFGWDGTNKGRKLTSVTPNVFFPASGYRYGSDGHLSSVGSSGYYWSASADGNSDGARNLYFGSSYWYWSNSNRSYGIPVRAVAEEE